MIRSRPINVLGAAKASQILYLSTDALGERNAEEALKDLGVSQDALEPIAP